MKLTEAINRFYYEGAINELRLMNNSVIQPTISYNTLLYMDIISYTENCTVSKLAKLLNVAKSAITGKVKVLIKKGLITKVQSSEDKRVFYLFVNKEIATQYYNEVRNRAVAEIEKKYSAKEVESFCDMLDILSQQFTHVVNTAIKD